MEDILLGVYLSMWSRGESEGWSGNNSRDLRVRAFFGSKGER